MDLHDLIEQTAYEIYAKSAKIEGRDIDNWLEGEKIVNNRYSYAEDYLDDILEAQPV